MEGVGVVLPVGDTGDFAEELLVLADKDAGEPLGRGRNQREVKAGQFPRLVHPLPHMGDDFKP